MRVSTCWITVLALCVSPLFLRADTSETIHFLTTLSPENEVPPVATEASANAIVTFHIRRDDNGDIISAIADFDVDYELPAVDMATGLHVHVGAVGINGAVQIDSGLSAANPADLDVSGALSRQVEVTDLETLEDLLDNPSGFYVNLHTPTNPDGLFRGQLSRAERAVFRTEMLPSNEVPPVPGLAASGAGSVEVLYSRDAGGQVTEASVRYDVSYDFPLAVTLTGLHIHPGAAGETGPPQLIPPLSADDPIVDADGNGTLSYTVAATSEEDLAVLSDLIANPAGAYLNLHSTANPSGAMRGQLGRTNEITFNFPILPENEVPPVDIDASGLAKVSFSVVRDMDGEITSGTVVLDASYMFPGEITFEGFHIHRAAEGDNGPVVIDSGITSSESVTDEDGVGNLRYVLNIGPNDEPAFTALQDALESPDGFYLNLHTSADQSGALRGQLAGMTTAPLVFDEGIVSATFGEGVNAASPGSLISIFGTDLAQGTGGAVVENGSLTTDILGTTVMIGGIPAPLLYVSPTQINAQIPYEVNAGTAAVSVSGAAGSDSAQTLTISSSSPGIFAAVKNSDFSLTSEMNPAAPGDALAVYATGLGAGNPAVATGQLPADDPLSVTTAMPIATIGGISAEVAASVMAPGLAGVQQINVIVPAGAPSGSQELQFSIDGVESNSVTIYVE
jgi:uncharacterized protein (TIGR03437 family)